MDIAITWDSFAERGDWSIAESDLALGDALDSAVLVSIFSDRIAPDQPTSSDTAVGISAPAGPIGSSGADRGGWWGDAFMARPIGSRLWQMRRAVKSGATAIPAEIKIILTEALQWLVDDGVAAAITVDAWWSAVSRQTVEFSVALTEPGVSGARVFRFSWAWGELQ